METDEDILAQKAQRALESYGVNLVVANLLQTYKDKVILFTGDGKQVPIVRDADHNDIELNLVRSCIEHHTRYIEAQVQSTNWPNGLLELNLSQRFYQWTCPLKINNEEKSCTGTSPAGVVLFDRPMETAPAQPRLKTHKYQQIHRKDGPDDGYREAHSVRKRRPTLSAPMVVNVSPEKQKHRKHSHFPNNKEHFRRKMKSTHWTPVGQFILISSLVQK